MKIHHLTVEEALASLQTTPSGLSSEEAARRLRVFGPNTIERIQGPSLLVRFLQQFLHFFALMLWLAAGLAFVAEWQYPGQGMRALGIAILGVIFINGVFAFWQEYRAERAVQALQRLLPDTVTTIRSGQPRAIPAPQLVPGDLIRLTAGDTIPADCRITEAFGARVSLATMTGEAAPQARDAEPSTVEDLLQSRNILLAGTAVVAGDVTAVVFATGMRTEFGQIAHLTQTAGEVQSPLQREIAHLSHLIAVLAILLGLVFFLIGWWRGLPLWFDALFAIGIIVANVPEGLLPTVTLALAMGSQRMARRHALVRHLPAVETLGSATVICTDKTGTLTENRMTVLRLTLGMTTSTIADLLQAQKLVEGYRPFFEVARYCHTLATSTDGGRPRYQGDPMEVALVQMAETAMPELPPGTRVDELPFDSDRKRLSVLYETPHGRMLYTKGALETLLPCCQGIRCGQEEISLTPSHQEQVLHAQAAMAEQGLRVLAFAYRPLPPDISREHWEEHLIYLGLVGLEDPPRPEVPAAIATCRQAGIRVIMVTGDHPLTACAIARQIGLVHTATPQVITGDHLQRLSDVQLHLALEVPEVIFARVGPGHKMRIVRVLQASGAVVAVTGDGVNDAPALKQGDIGVAMGVVGTDVAKEAADVILLDDNFASIVRAVEEGRTVFDNIRKFLTYILTSNIPELVPYLAFALFAIPLPLTILQILAVDLGTDLLPALALGADPPRPDVMQRPPRSRRERLITALLLLRAYLFLGVMEAVAAMAAFFAVLTDGGWRYGQPLSTQTVLYRQATTATLSAIVVMQVVNVFLCRSGRESVFRQALFMNPLLYWGIAVEVGLILLIDYTTLGNAIFRTAPLPWPVWVFILPFAFGMLVLEEVRKWITRKMVR